MAFTPMPQPPTNELSTPIPQPLDELSELVEEPTIMDGINPVRKIEI